VRVDCSESEWQMMGSTECGFRLTQNVENFLNNAKCKRFSIPKLFVQYVRLLFCDLHCWWRCHFEIGQCSTGT